MNLEKAIITKHTLNISFRQGYDTNFGKVKRALDNVEVVHRGNHLAGYLCLASEGLNDIGSIHLTTTDKDYLLMIGKEMVDVLEAHDCDWLVLDNNIK